MGKRKGRRTRSDRAHDSARPSRASSFDWWDLARLNPLTFEGQIQQMHGVSAYLARARGRRSAVARFIWLLPLPPAAIASAANDAWRWWRRRHPRD